VLNKDRLERIAKKKTLSPLRYPGGKRKIVPLLADIYSRDTDRISLFVEPFIGGGAVSIAFLESGFADEVALSDLDPLVAAFWRVVFSKNAQELADLVFTSKVSLATWHSVKHSTPADDVGKAFKCLFLNRTNFSGILNESVGPIGGQSQSGKYKIDCRFNQTDIAERIIELSELRRQVRFVRCQCYSKTINNVIRTKKARQKPNEVCWYFDPPFFEKAESLYRKSFDLKQHYELKKTLLERKLPGSWLLSYDDVPQIRDMYSLHGGFARVNLSYNARIDRWKRLVSSEVIVSNTLERLRANGVNGVPKMGQIIRPDSFSNASAIQQNVSTGL